MKWCCTTRNIPPSPTARYRATASRDPDDLPVSSADTEFAAVGYARAQRFGAVAGDLYAETLVPEGGRDEIGDVGFVVDDEDAGVSHIRMMPYQPVVNL